ncbi:MAG: hypothetical protein CMF75_08380 [Maricaulis sp.]|nr:hypothetical protein [Maricaulis sp.]
MSESRDFIGLDTIKPLMQRDVLTLVREWLPLGKRDGAYWVAPNPRRAKDKPGSFKVWLSGPAAGGFREWDGGPDEKGDIIDLPIYCGLMRDRAHVLEWGLARYGFKSGDVRLIETRKAEAQAANADQEKREAAERAGKIKLAQKLWRGVVPLEPGQLAWDYITKARGVRLDTLYPDPFHSSFADVGFLPDCLYAGPEGKFALPAMVAAMRQPDGSVSGLHRTYLDAETMGKARLASSKKMLGVSTSAAIRVWTPPGADVLILTEGIEDAFSCAIARPDYACWAVGSLNGLMSFDYPPDGGPAPRAIVFADNDWAGGPAAAKLAAALRRLSNFSKPVSLARAHGGAKDANDLLRGES